MVSLFGIWEHWPVWAILQVYSLHTLSSIIIKSTLRKLSLRIVICFFFSSHRLHLSWGTKKKSVVWQPWSQSCFLPARINGYERGERKSERRRRGPPYGLLYLQASFSFVWWSSTDKSFLTEAKLRGSNNCGAMGEHILAARSLPKLVAVERKPKLLLFRFV